MSFHKGHLAAGSWYMTNIYNAFYVYSAVMILVLVVFGGLGILPQLIDIYNKTKLFKELDTTNASMQSNIVALQEMETTLNTNKVYFDYLDRYMPEEVSVQDYMLDFINSAGQAGFAVKSFNQAGVASKEPGQYMMTISLESSLYPDVLIKSIEQLKRVTTVDKVFLYRDSFSWGPSYGIHLALKIFSYQGAK